MPLRSLLIGDTDHYFSPYIFGVQQAMARLGHWHSQVSIRQPPSVISQRVKDVRPDILWTHMLLWAPHAAPPVDALVEIAAGAAKRGARVIIHDGDYKAPARYPKNISSWAALALCNHKFDRSAWGIPTLYWPYFAFAQDQIAAPIAQYRCDLFFAGQLKHDATYGARTKLLEDVRKRGVALQVVDPAGSDGNTLFRTAAIASSATSVLGFGRPSVNGWVDTRVFQYPGAGAILVHDHAPQLEPWVHYAPYSSSSAASIAETVARIKAAPPSDMQALRERAFSYVQQHHSSVARVREVLDTLFK